VRRSNGCMNTVAELNTASREHWRRVQSLCLALLGILSLHWDAGAGQRIDSVSPDSDCHCPSLRRLSRMLAILKAGSAHLVTRQ
jgi:hypothetical protein